MCTREEKEMLRRHKESIVAYGRDLKAALPLEVRELCLRLGLLPTRQTPSPQCHLTPLYDAALSLPAALVGHRNLTARAVCGMDGVQANRVISEMQEERRRSPVLHYLQLIASLERPSEINSCLVRAVTLTLVIAWCGDDPDATAIIFTARAFGADSLKRLLAYATRPENDSYPSLILSSPYASFEVEESLKLICYSESHGLVYTYPAQCVFPLLQFLSALQNGRASSRARMAQRARAWILNDTKYGIRLFKPVPLLTVQALAEDKSACAKLLGCSPKLTTLLPAITKGGSNEKKVAELEFLEEIGECLSYREVLGGKSQVNFADARIARRAALKYVLDATCDPTSATRHQSIRWKTAEDALNELSKAGPWGFRKSIARLKPLVRQLPARGDDDDWRPRPSPLLTPLYYNKPEALVALRALRFDDASFCYVLSPRELGALQAARSADTSKVAKAWAPPCLHPCLEAPAEDPHRGPHFWDHVPIGNTRLTRYRPTLDTRILWEDNAQMEAVNEAMEPQEYWIQNIGVIKKNAVLATRHFHQRNGHLAGQTVLSPFCPHCSTLEAPRASMWCFCPAAKRKTCFSLLRESWHLPSGYLSNAAWRTQNSRTLGINEEQSRDLCPMCERGWDNATSTGLCSDCRAIPLRKHELPQSLGKGFEFWGPLFLPLPPYSRQHATPREIAYEVAGKIAGKRREVYIAKDGYWWWVPRFGSTKRIDGALILRQNESAILPARVSEPPVRRPLDADFKRCDETRLLFWLLSREAVLYKEGRHFGKAAHPALRLAPIPLTSGSRYSFCVGLNVCVNVENNVENNVCVNGLEVENVPKRRSVIIRTPATILEKRFCQRQIQRQIKRSLGEREGPTDMPRNTLRIAGQHIVTSRCPTCLKPSSSSFCCAETKPWRCPCGHDRHMAITTSFGTEEWLCLSCQTLASSAKRSRKSEMSEMSIPGATTVSFSTASSVLEAAVNANVMSRRLSDTHWVLAADGTTIHTNTNLPKTKAHPKGRRMNGTQEDFRRWPVIDITNDRAAASSILGSAHALSAPNLLQFLMAPAALTQNRPPAPDEAPKAIAGSFTRL